MNRYKIIFRKNFVIIIASLLFTGGCTKSVLDKGPLGTFSAEFLWTDQALVTAYMADVYNNAQLLPSAENIFEHIFDYTFALISLSDQGRFRSTNNNNSGYQSANGSTTGTNTSHVLQNWGGFFNYLRTLNIAIEQLSKPANSLEKSFREQTLGELYFFRAAAYFEMAKRYGGVPIIKIPQDVTKSSKELQVPRSKEVEVYDFIAEDLDKAYDYLKDKTVDLSRVSHWVVKLIKSRAMLSAGSIAANDAKLVFHDANGLVGIKPSEATRFFQASLDASKELLPAPLGKGIAPFKLMPGSTPAEYRKIFSEVGTAVDKESMMLFEYNGPEAFANNWDMFLLPRASPDHTTWGAGINGYAETVTWFDYKDGTPGTMLPPSLQKPTGSNLLLDNLGDNIYYNLDTLWGNKDPRFKSNVAYPGLFIGTNRAYFHDKVKDAAAATAAGVPGRAPAQNFVNSALSLYKRGKAEHPAVADDIGTTPVTIYRFSEAYLNFAEAALGLGLPADATTALNAIRTRVAMPVIPTATMDAIKKERRVELMSEGFRYWDLLRWRDAVAPLSTNYGGILFTFDVAANKFALRLANAENIQRQFKPQQYYLPIPLTEINTNNVLVQNPGYN